MFNLEKGYIHVIFKGRENNTVGGSTLNAEGPRDKKRKRGRKGLRYSIL